ncbi:hypothetical protein RCH23_000297 [Cryobacterium sp. CAN_C3]|nr:hypothetical protein [Cryobacterium sp. CAN_C3]
MPRRQLFFYFIALGGVVFAVFISSLLRRIRGFQQPGADWSLVLGAAVVLLAAVIIIRNRPSKW